MDFLSRTEPDMIKKITMDLKDRKLQVWKRNSMSSDLYNEKFLSQKLVFITYIAPLKYYYVEKAFSIAEKLCRYRINKSCWSALSRFIGTTNNNQGRQRVHFFHSFSELF